MSIFNLIEAIKLVRTAHEALEFARAYVPENMWETINCNASYEIEHLLCALKEEKRRWDIDAHACEPQDGE